MLEVDLMTMTLYHSSPWRDDLMEDHATFHRTLRMPMSTMETGEKPPYAW